MDFISKVILICFPLLTVIFALPAAIMQFATNILNFRAARLKYNDAKRAAATPGAGNTTQKLSVGTINGNGNHVHNTHQHVGNGSAAISGDGNRTAIDNSQHTHNHASSKGTQASNDDAFDSIALAVVGSLLIAGAFLISWPTISWILAACWVTCLVLIGWQVKLLSPKSINSPESAILNVLYPASLLAIVGGTWLALLGAGKYNMATIYTTVSGHYESHPQGSMVARFIQAVTASYGTAGFTLIMLNLLAALFMLGTLIQCFKYSINVVIAVRRGTVTNLSIQEASMSFFLAAVSLVACQPALAELIVSQFNK